MGGGARGCGIFEKPFAGRSRPNTQLRDAGDCERAARWPDGLGVWNSNLHEVIVATTYNPEGAAMSIIWTIIIGFVAGLIAKFLHPGPNEPSGFILTTILGIIGAFVATYLGQAVGWYRAGEGAGLIGAVVGAIIILVIWSLVSRKTA